MKIEINVDDQTIIERVIEQVTRQVRDGVSADVAQTIKAAVSAEIKLEVARQAKLLFENFKLDDGRTMRDYIADRLTKRNDEGGHGRRLLRIEEVVNITVANETERLWRELVTPHLEDVRKRIREDFVVRLMKEASSS